ncbi:hypothetical protein KU306_03985 [Haloferax larsenii]|uniref:DUF7344 domain-containing protein n=1 Tax=Haloferax larsenii TaxID=302484 RepID=A0ABY5RHZ6_HALLR|nr:hypothetical protein [Haloferax larsenii]ELZ80878.1 hypothetical protein C455_05437 [Haloferax larsenii JCM 13917]UVE51053.1 hypothetical protein KU306_03985 [Haloferax larsenii]
MSTIGSAERSPASTDELFDILGDHRRRAIIAELGSQTSPVTLFGLAGALSQRDPSHRGLVDEELVVVLHHVHLPKLDRAGLVEYDPSLQLVTFESSISDVGESVSDVESELDAMRDALA